MTEKTPAEMFRQELHELIGSSTKAEEMLRCGSTIGQVSHALRIPLSTVQDLARELHISIVTPPKKGGPIVRKKRQQRVAKKAAKKLNRKK